MPYDPAQVRLFQMIAHDKIKRKGLTPGKAKSLLKEAGQSHSSGHGPATRALTGRK